MKRKKPDFWLIFITFILVGFGLVMVFSASYPKGLTNPHIQDGYFFFKKQLIFAIIGLCLFFIASNIRYTIYRKYVGVIVFICFLSLILVTIPGIGHYVNGARRWIYLGLFSFQPSEYVKLGMIIYTASIMVKKQDVLDRFGRAIIPPLVVIALICFLLLLQPHYSATIIIVATCTVILFCAGAKLRHLILLGCIGLPLLIGILFLGDYRVERVTTLFDPLSDTSASGYQIMQSLIAIGPGGLTGNGLGRSIQKMAYLPEAHNDFIFSIVAEELGFIGGASLILVFVLLIARGILISLRAPDQFGTLLGVGIVTLFALEIIFNLGMVTALLPVTGVPLPLISYGGTALIIKLTILGILLNISRYRIQKKTATSGTR